MNNKWISRLEDVMLQLGAVHDAMAKTSLSSNEYNPISGNFAKAKVELFNLYNEIKEDTSTALPNLAKSTKNLSKIKNKDEWLDEVRGKEGLEDKFKSFPVGIATCYLYDKESKQCAKIAQQHTNSKLEELERWIDENQFYIKNRECRKTVYVGSDGIKTKINSLKQES